jgi:preprotein translocase subunit SecG
MPFLIGTLALVLTIISLFMILLVLIQRGRGGGLAGAFGGMGGQSAFGTRAGDIFTRITIVLAVVWVLLAGGLGMLMRRDAQAAATGERTTFPAGEKSQKKEEQPKDETKTESSGSTDSKKGLETIDIKGAPAEDGKAFPANEEPKSAEPSTEAKPSEEEPAEAKTDSSSDDSTPPESAKTSDEKTSEGDPDSEEKTSPEPLSEESIPPAETDPKSP